MSGSAGIIASMAKALSAIRPASIATISRVLGRRLPSGSLFVSNGITKAAGAGRPAMQEKSDGPTGQGQRHTPDRPADGQSFVIFARTGQGAGGNPGGANVRSF